MCASSKPSSCHPVMPPIISLTGRPSSASRTAALLAPLQCGPSAPAAPPPPQPKVRSNAGAPPEVYARELKRLYSFLDGDWNPDDSPLRPRRRYGW
jgi:hypothetical protein